LASKYLPYSEIASRLVLCDSPKASEILEKWIERIDNTLLDTAARSSIEYYLKAWHMRRAIQQRQKEIFRDWVAGRMSPDDLLLPQPSWIWKDGQYVQKD